MFVIFPFHKNVCFGCEPCVVHSCARPTDCAGLSRCCGLSSVPSSIHPAFVHFIHSYSNNLLPIQPSSGGPLSHLHQPLSGHPFLPFYFTHLVSGACLVLVCSHGRSARRGVGSQSGTATIRAEFGSPYTPSTSTLTTLIIRNE